MSVASSPAIEHRRIAAMRSAGLDQVIGASEKRLRQRDPDGGRGLQVDCQVQFRRLFNRDVARGGALENFVHLDHGPATEVVKIRPVGHQKARVRKQRKLADRQQPVAGC